MKVKLLSFVEWVKDNRLCDPIVEECDTCEMPSWAPNCDRDNCPNMGKLKAMYHAQRAEDIDKLNQAGIGWI